MCGRSGKDFPIGLTQDIKMGSCVFKFDVPHQWIEQRHVGPVLVYCDGVMSCLRHDIPVWQHNGQSTTVTRTTYTCFMCSRWLLQAGTVVIWSQMVKSYIKPKKNIFHISDVFICMSFMWPKDSLRVKSDGRHTHMLRVVQSLRI